MKITEAELKALKYVGRLGHKFIVLRTDLQRRPLDCAAECNSVERAKKTIADWNGEGKPLKGARIYQQLSGRKWKRLA